MPNFKPKVKIEMRDKATRITEMRTKVFLYLMTNINYFCALDELKPDPNKNPVALVVLVILSA